MSRLRILAAFMIALMAAPVTWAADSIPLTISGAIDAALNDRKDIRIGQLNRQSAEAKVLEAKGAYFPTIDFFTDAYRENVYDPYTGAMVSVNILGQTYEAEVKKSVPLYQVASGLEINTSLYSGGLLSAKVDQAVSEEQAASAHYQITRKALVLEVATAYWNLRKAQIEEMRAADALGAIQEEERVASSRFEQGRLSRLDLETVGLRVLEAEVRYANASNNIKDQWRAYESTIGVQGEGERAKGNPQLLDNPETFRVEDIRDLTGLALDAEIAEAQANWEGANARVRVQSAEFQPKLNLYGRYNLVGRDTEHSDDAFRDLHKEVSFVGVRLNWNLFNGFQSRQRLRQAESAAYTGQLRLEQAILDKKKDILEKTALVKSREQAVVLAKRRRALADMELRVAKARLESNQISRLDLRSREEAAKDAAAMVDITQIDLALARLSRVLAGNDVGLQTQAVAH